jgi:hypothetical protein
MKAVIEDWKRSYGPTFPLYGNNTVRHDISGSVRPLLASTEIPQRIMNGELQFVSEEIADKLTTAMDRADVWHNEFQPYLVSC